MNVRREEVGRVRGEGGGGEVCTEEGVGKEEDGKEEGFDIWAGKVWSIAKIKDLALSVKPGKSGYVLKEHSLKPLCQEEVQH